LTFEDETQTPLYDLRVPTATFVAEVVLADGEALHGRFFVPSHTSLHPGPMRPDERLNDDADFFPFLPADATEPVILNKRQVAWVTFDTRSFPRSGEDESLEILSPEHRVTVDCRGKRLEGVLVIDLPDYKSRVLDRLNQPERFLRIKDGDLLHYVSRDHISKVVEMTNRGGA
jgi:hypothetical protein